MQTTTHKNLQLWFSSCKGRTSNEISIFFPAPAPPSRTLDVCHCDASYIDTPTRGFTCNGGTGTHVLFIWVSAYTDTNVLVSHTDTPDAD